MDQEKMNASVHTVRPNLKPRTFSPRIMNPTREQIQAYVRSWIGNIKDPDDINCIDEVVDNAYYHFTGIASFNADIAEIYYEAIEEIWAQLDE